MPLKPLLRICLQELNPQHSSSIYFVLRREHFCSLIIDEMGLIRLILLVVIETKGNITFDWSPGTKIKRPRNAKIR